jgi:PAS domain S-box-containing protein
MKQRRLTLEAALRALVIAKDGWHHLATEEAVLASRPNDCDVIRPEGFPRALIDSADGRFEPRVRASEAQLRSILETAPDVISNVNRHGRILFINRTVGPLRVEDVIGTSCFDYVAAEDRERVRRAIEHVFSTASLDEYEISGPPDHSGTRGWSCVRAGPVLEGGKVVAVTLCATDITERKRVEAEQRRLVERLERMLAERAEVDAIRERLEEQLRQSQKVESIGRLAGGVAHDFNNILTSVLSFTELALLDVPNGSEAATHLESVLEAAERGATLTQQLLAFARKKVVKPEVVDLNAILRRMAPMLRRLVGECVELKLLLATELGLVKVDVGSMEQVIMSLVLNARDALGGAGRITLETGAVELDDDYCEPHAEMRPGRYVRLAISDTGSGMSAAVQARLFEPFFTTKPQGEGTGLGLAMCHGLVKQAGGNISVYSELGHGSSFGVYLPEASGERSKAVRLAPSALSARGRETLLLVEDEQMILRAAQEALRGFGYRVLSARDGAQALELSERTKDPIHLVITDVIMPGIGGRTLAERLAARRPNIRILYSSGYVENTIVDRGVLDDGVNFLQKPYTATALAKRVREVLDKG